jgi:hypothetical protein
VVLSVHSECLVLTCSYPLTCAHMCAHIMQELLTKAKRNREIRFLHVKGHSGNQWNDAADAAANTGARGCRTPPGGVLSDSDDW